MTQIRGLSRTSSIYKWVLTSLSISTNTKLTYKTILLLLLSFSYYRLLIAFTRLMCEIRSYCYSYLKRGILDRLLLTRGCFTNCAFTHNKLLRRQVHKTLIHYL
jgi:hypothetical protein